MIKLFPPKAYGEIKPLANHLGLPIRLAMPIVTPPLRLKKRRRRRSRQRPGAQERNAYHV
jgi:hypothetical protein